MTAELIVLRCHRCKSPLQGCTLRSGKTVRVCVQPECRALYMDLMLARRDLARAEGSGAGKAAIGNARLAVENALNALYPLRAKSR